MEFLEQELLGLLKRKPSISTKEIERELKIEDENGINYLINCLNELELNGIIYRGNNEVISLLKDKPSIIQGKVRFDSNGNARIKGNDNREVMIPKNKTEGLIEKDVITVTNLFYNQSNELTGSVDKIIKRQYEQLSCEVVFENGKNYLVPYHSKVKNHVRINQRQLEKWGAGEILLIRLYAKPSGGLDGEFVKKIGHVSEPDVDEKAILYDHGFNTEFSQKVLKEIEKIPSTVNAEEALKEGRRDLREKTMVTIDGASTKDIDDSVGIEVLPNGNYKLYVNIADVAHYVKEDSAINKEAYERATSVYPNDSVSPMFHPKISNGICSLHPHVNRLTKTCEMIIDKNGKIVDYDIYDSIINSRKKMTYEDVNKILVNGQMVPGYEEFYECLKTMEKLSSILEKEKIKRGYINFSRKEISAKGRGQNITFETKGQNVAEKIIENFMLSANNTVSSHVFVMGLPFIFRVHESPDEDKMKAFLFQLEQMGFKFKNCKSITSNKFIQQISEQLLACDEFDILSELLLISAMKRAKYSSINIGHYGLLLRCYGHFTSPIRRYADLQVHRLLNLYKNMVNIDYNELDKYLTAVANHCTERSNEAAKVEREAMEMRVAEYLENNVGEKFNARITYVSPSFIKVKTDQGFCGSISTSDFKGTTLKYDGKRNCFLDEKNGVTYTIGTPLEVQVKEANRRSRIIRFTSPKLISKEMAYTKTKKHH